MVKVLPPPPSGLFHLSRVMIALLDFSKLSKESIIFEWDFLNIFSSSLFILVSDNFS